MIKTVPISRRLLSQGAWAFSGRAVTTISALAVNVLLARLLAPDDLGAYFLILTLVSISALLAQMGLSQTAVRTIAEALGKGMPGRTHAIIRSILRYAVAGTVLVTVGLLVGGGKWIALHVFGSPTIAGLVGVATVWVAVLTFQNLIVEMFRGFHDIRLATIFGGMVTGGLSAIIFLLIWLIQGHASLEHAIVFIIVSGVVNLLVSAVFLRWKVTALKGGDRSMENSILKIAIPLLLNNVTMFVLTQADIWILGAFRPHNEVALYGATARFIILIDMPLLIVNAVLPPLVTLLFVQGKKEELQSTLQTTATLAAIPALAVTLAFLLFGNPILGLVYGEYYRGGSLILRVLSVGQILNVVAGSCGLTLIMTGHQFTLLKITILTGIITVVGDLWVVTVYGPLGVAVVTASALILQNVMMLLFVKRQVGVWTNALFMSPNMIKAFWTHEIS